MISEEDKSWNIRDRHMADTLESILKVHENSKAIVWAHNTHIGDHRFTDMVDQGEVNIGGLGRDLFKDVALVGFGTYKGTVIASNKWGGKIKTLPVPPGQFGSWDAYFHHICEDLQSKGCVVNFTELNHDERKEFNVKKGQRAIGVVYHPTYEFGNYVPTIIGKRYDVLIFIDETHALDHIDVTAPDRKEIPHDYPFNA
jgi:erythromycin esterase-like protein